MKTVISIQSFTMNDLFTDISVNSIEIREWDNDELIDTITDEDFIAALIADLESAKSSTTANLDIPNPDYQLLFFAEDKIVQELSYYTEEKLYNGKKGQFTSFKEDRHYGLSTELPINNHHWTSRL